MKRLLSVCLAVVAVLAMQTCAAADFFLDGLLSDSNIPFGFDPDEAVAVSNGEVNFDQDYEEVYTGTAIYLPIVKEINNTISAATDKDIKDNKVEVSYKAIRGNQFISGVSIVDGAKEKIKDLPGGTYAKIQMANDFTSTGTARFEIRLVLSVNRVSYRETETGLEGLLQNRIIYVDDNTVYGARVPTVFVADGYTGEATFDMGGGVMYTGYVRARQKYLLDYTTAPNPVIDEMYPNAHLEFYGFLGGDRATFDKTGRLEIPIKKANFMTDNGKPRVFAYQIIDNSLVALASDVVSTSSKNDKLYISTRTPGQYVLSNQSLQREVNESEETILDSGYAAQPAPQSTSQPAAQSSSAAPQRPAAVQPSAPPVPTPVSTSTTTNIHADNTGTDNPTTGAAAFPAVAAVTLLPSGGICVSMLRKRRQKLKIRADSHE